MLSLSVVMLLLVACGAEPDPVAEEPVDTAEDADAVEEPEDEPEVAEEEPEAAEEEPELIPVRLAIAAGSFNPGHSPQTSVPLELGYWEEEGLDVEVIAAGGSPGSIQHVEANQADLGLAAPSALIPAVAAGVDVLAYFNHLSSNIFVPAVPDDSPIQSVADFEGATIGVSSLEAAAVPLTRGLMVHEEVDPDSATFVAIGTGVEAYNFTERGDVDVLSHWDTVYAEIENLGLPLRQVAPDWFKDMTFHQVMYARSDYIRDNPEVIVGMARGLAKAHAFGEENPEAAVRIHWDHFPESRPAGVSEDEAVEQAVRVLEVRNQHTAKRDGVWGDATQEEVQAALEFYVAAGIIDTAPSVDDIWTGEFVDEINDFDEQAVRQQASDHSN